MGVWHHGDPDWFQCLGPEAQAKVYAVLDIMGGEEPVRHRLPIPITAWAKLELVGKKLKRTPGGNRPRPGLDIPPPPTMRIDDAGTERDATPEEAAQLQPYVDQMARRAMLASGSTAEGLKWAFSNG